MLRSLVGSEMCIRDRVKQNIYLGGALAIAILLLFLRSWRPTVIVGVAIPVAVIGSFVAMASLGRSINVISLAGLAFAVGMVANAASAVITKATTKDSTLLLTTNRT